VAELIKAADPEWRTLVLLGARTGARLVWLTSLRWSQVDLAREDLANSGSNPEVRRKLTGHKPPSVHDLHPHFERETLRAAVHAIPSLPEL
jgi:hypothetical protein